MKIQVTHLVCFTVLIFLSSCLYDNPNDLAQVNVVCDTTECYITIKPIVMTNCAITGCHVAGGIGVGDFTVFENFRNDALNGKLKYRINLPFSNADHMPKYDSLTVTDISTLNNWIDNGADGCW